MTPTGWMYFDYYQDTSSKSEPLAIGGFLPMSKVYSYDPIPASLTEEQKKMILGTQANVWTEYMSTTDQVEYMVYPRALALSEVAWSPASSHNYDEFVGRVNRNRPLLEQWHVNFARHVFKNSP